VYLVYIDCGLLGCDVVCCLVLSARKLNGRVLKGRRRHRVNDTMGLENIGPVLETFLRTSDLIVRSEFLTAVRMMIFFWAVMPCRLVGRYQRSSPEDGDSMFPRNMTGAVHRTLNLYDTARTITLTVAFQFVQRTKKANK
jgi:hypothetical protein